MKVIEFTQEEPYIQAFLDLPKRLYDDRERMQNAGEEEKLLRGTHFLNRYVTLTKLLLLTQDGEAAARCVLTEYPEDEKIYFGFFECIEDREAAFAVMEAAEQIARKKGYEWLLGPLDVSIWIRYRFKTNMFHRRPYAGEPYNKPYYPQWFLEGGYRVRAQYASNRYQKLPLRDFALPKYKERYDEFRKMGYEIRSPRPEEWYEGIRQVYRLISRLYTGFEAYKPIEEEEFVSFFSGYRLIADLSMIKLAWYKGKAVGFFMGIPNYHNLSARKIGLMSLAEIFFKRIRSPEYVLLYMGVEPEHRGLGKALTHSIMEELAKKRAVSIGALIRYENKNFNYAQEVMEDERYRYVFLEKRVSDIGLSETGL